jgi:hypothetical protein
MNTWADVNAWRQRQAKVWQELAWQLLELGWTIVYTDDGQYGARRLREGDPLETFSRDGDPEVSGRTPELLLATVRAVVQKGLGAA